MCGTQGRGLVKVRSQISRKSRNKRRGREQGGGELRWAWGTPGWPGLLGPGASGFLPLLLLVSYHPISCCCTLFSLSFQSPTPDWPTSVSLFCLLFISLCLSVFSIFLKWSFLHFSLCHSECLSVSVSFCLLALASLVLYPCLPKNLFSVCCVFLLGCLYPHLSVYLCVCVFPGWLNVCLFVGLRQLKTLPVSHLQL